MAAGRRQKERKGLHNKILAFLWFGSCHKKWLFIIQKLMSWYLKSEPKGESRDFVWIGYISRLQRGVWAGENAVEGDNSWQYEGRFWLIPTSSSIYNPYLGTFPAPHRAARCLGDPPPPPPHHIDDAHHHITEIQRSLRNGYTQHQTKCFHLHNSEIHQNHWKQAPQLWPVVFVRETETNLK